MPARRGHDGIGRERLEQDPAAGDADRPATRPIRAEQPEHRPPGPPGGGGDRLADHVGARPQEDAGGQVGPQVEDPPGVDPTLGDLGHGEDEQEQEEPVGPEPGRRAPARPGGPAPAASSPGGPGAPGATATTSRSERAWAHRATATAATATAGQSQRHDNPACRTTPATAAPLRAPMLNRAWNRTRAPGRPRSRRDAAAFIAVSTQPPDTSAATKSTAKAGQARARAAPTKKTAQASSDHVSSRPVPQRSARCPTTAPVTAAMAMATANRTPSWA